MNRATRRAMQFGTHKQVEWSPNRWVHQNNACMWKEDAILFRSIQGNINLAWWLEESPQPYVWNVELH